MRILITGISSGIGLSVSNDLAKSNHSVYGVARSARPSPVKLDKRVNYQTLNISDAAALDLYLQTIASKNKLDAIILNAGIVGPYGHFRNLEIKDVKSVFETNLFPNIQILSRLENLLSAGGSVVVISSNTLKFNGSSDNLPYATSKASLEMAALIAAKTFASSQYKFRINIIRPGVISTGLGNKVTGYDSEKYANRVALIPKGRPGNCNDIFNVINFLIDPKSDYIFGQVIAVSGGE